MKLSDIDHEKGYIKVTGKGRKERVVRIGKTAQKAVWRYLMYRPQNQYQELWLTEEGKPLHGVGVQCFIKRLKQRAGINGAGSTHRFRHTFAVNFLRADRNVFNLQYLLGHLTALSASLKGRITSNSVLHLGHAYSYIGIVVSFIC